MRNLILVIKGIWFTFVDHFVPEWLTWAATQVPGSFLFSMVLTGVLVLMMSTLGVTNPYALFIVAANCLMLACYVFFSVSLPILKTEKLVPDLPSSFGFLQKMKERGQKGQSRN